MGSRFNPGCFLTHSITSNPPLRGIFKSNRSTVLRQRIERADCRNFPSPPQIVNGLFAVLHPLQWSGNLRLLEGALDKVDVVVVILRHEHCPLFPSGHEEGSTQTAVVATFFPANESTISYS